MFPIIPETTAPQSSTVELQGYAQPIAMLLLKERHVSFLRPYSPFSPTLFPCAILVCCVPSRLLVPTLPLISHVCACRYHNMVESFGKALPCSHLYLFPAGNWGVHLTIPKWAFTNINDTETPYVPLTVTGGSNLLNETMAAVASANNIATAG